ncbi:MAG: hypothetical protein ACJZ72_10200 [Opitutales bacterium]
MNSFFTFWILKPKSNYWIFLPLGYTFFLQILTGFPKPESLKKFDANDLFIRFSEELFGYPFWLQDLSHLPLFFALAWLWSWKLGPINVDSQTCSKIRLFSFQRFMRWSMKWRRSLFPTAFLPWAI